MKVTGSGNIPFDTEKPVLIRGTNWIGDVIMTLPAIAAVRHSLPQSHITVLAKPWVAELYRISPDVDEVIEYESPGMHDGITGKFRLAGQLQKRNFAMAILLQNAIEAAMIVWLARIPIRMGYNSDARGVLLTHSVHRTKEIRTIHQIHYYLEMLKSLGFKTAGELPKLPIGENLREISQAILNCHDITPEDTLVGMAPGATFGPAKMWFPERFAAVGDQLVKDFSAKIILFGSKGDRERAERVQQYSNNRFVNLAGTTSLKEAIALIASCRLFITNDSGLMHLAGALAIPLVAIFGSTNPATTSPAGGKSIIIHHDIPCSPCLKKVCPTDFRCMDMIAIDDVYGAAEKFLLNL
ncbi:MAG: lipopolysaccharide heptosyltransferase II [Deltaproteobacteria bacterium]|nr:lipopolysaccharide heptosyltransferase II [Deltaproteobacteria bacterium]